MTGGKLGRGFAELPIEEQVQALRDNAIAQELLIKVLYTAVERLGVTFAWPGDGEPASGDDD